MISPPAQTLCCLLGLAAAGIPLVYFTTPGEAPPAAAAAPAADERAAVPAAVWCSGRPLLVQLRSCGELLCELSPQQGCWQGELELPAAAELIELEAEVSWAPGAEGPAAITIELTPPGRPARQDTQWALPPENSRLHSIFTFSWQ